METLAAWLNIDGNSVSSGLCEAAEKLDGAGGEIVLDFGSVRRVDSSALRAIEGLARTADEKSVKIVIRDINVEVYKVLKLVRLASRFSFVN